MKKTLLTFVFVLMTLFILQGVSLAGPWIYPTEQSGGSLDEFWWGFGADPINGENYLGYQFNYGDGSYEKGHLYAGNQYITDHIFYSVGTFTQELWVWPDASPWNEQSATAVTYVNTRWSPIP